MTNEAGFAGHNLSTPPEHNLMAAPEEGGFVLRAWRVSVDGMGGNYLARSRGKALAASWGDYAANWPITFGQFLKVARCRLAEPDARLGEAITVGGRPAYWCGCNRSQVLFCRPDSDVVMNSHPYDVEPPEARRGTSYYAGAAA